MENINSTPPFGAPQVNCTQNSKEKKKCVADGRDQMMLVRVWGVGTLAASLLLGPGMPGLGISFCVTLWYGALFLYRGKRGFGGKVSLLDRKSVV